MIPHDFNRCKGGEASAHDCYQCLSYYNCDKAAEMEMEKINNGTEDD